MYAAFTRRIAPTRVYARTGQRGKKLTRNLLSVLIGKFEPGSGRLHQVLLNPTPKNSVIENIAYI
jgi:hypothetical protein